MTTRSLAILLVFPAFAAISCDGAPGPECSAIPEDCNDLDDDCDGRIDEGDSGGPLRRDCSNACGPGQEECQEGEWVYCSAPQPTNEECNGLDDDCDGRVDEDCGCSHGQTRPCGTDEGECELGVATCDSGVWGDCMSAYEPRAETCDGLDNDCDGQIDEGCSCEPGTTTTCGTDVGECSPGTLTCGAGGTWDPECAGEVGPEADVCDGLDNDCDGEADYIVSIAFGWVEDEHEPNDSCGSASPIFNSSGLPQLTEGEGWVSPAVRDGSDLMSYPTLYSMLDEDWYYTRAIEAGRTCVPWTSQCSFRLTAQLELLDREHVEGAVQEPDDWQLCVYLGDCASTTSGGFCTQGTNWQESASSYVMSIIWGGTCGSDDSRDVKLRVWSPTGGACGHYQVYATFEYDTATACP